MRHVRLGWFGLRVCDLVEGVNQSMVGERQGPLVMPNEEFERLREEQRVSLARRLEEARREQIADGKEPFDLIALEAIYDTTNETNRCDPDPAVRTAFWEEKYYLLHPNVRTIREFAEVRKVMDLWS